MSTSIPIIDQNISSKYIEIRDFQRRITELQRANINLKMIIVDRENQMSRMMIDGHIDRDMINEFIQSAKQTDELNSKIRNLSAEVEESQTTISELRQQIDNYKNTEDQLRNEISKLKAKNQYYAKKEIPESPTTSRTITALKLEISQLKQDIATQEARNAELMVQQLNLQSRLNDYENDGIRSGTEVNRVKRQLNDARQEMSFIKTENEHLKAEIDALNEQIQEKTNKIGRKSKKNRALQRQIQNHLNEVHIYNSKLQKRSQLFTAQFEDLGRNIEEQNKYLQERFNKFQRTIQFVMAEKIGIEKRNFKNKTFQQTEVIERLSSLCAQIANISSSNVPEIEDLITDPVTLELFAGRVKTAIEMQRASAKSDINKLELKAKQIVTQQNSTLSTSVARFITNLQGSMNEITKTLHQDHLQLIEALTISDDDIFD